jgi:uncharacterized membrane protein
MADFKKLFEEKNIHLLFEISLIFKALLALIEVAGGLTIMFIPHNAILEYVQSIAKYELAEDPTDLIANYLRHWAEHFSLNAQYFAAFYLLSHGIVKLWLIAGLLRNKLWYYPVSMVIFGAFTLYQIYRYTFTHSITLILITFFDLLVIWLIWHEYRYMKRNKG